MKIILYRKSGCPWAAGVIGFLNELAIPFEIRNVSVWEEFAREVEQKSGQCKRPHAGHRWQNPRGRQCRGCSPPFGETGVEDLSAGMPTLDISR